MEPADNASASNRSLVTMLLSPEVAINNNSQTLSSTGGNTENKKIKFVGYIRVSGDPVKNKDTGEYEITLGARKKKMLDDMTKRFKSHWPDSEIISGYGEACHIETSGIKKLLDIIIKNDIIELNINSKIDLDTQYEIIKYLIEMKGGKLNVMKN